MLKKLTFAAAIVGLLAATPALAKKKSDAEIQKEWEEKVTEKYVEKKKGALFNDFSHWVDLEKLEDSRWNVPKDLSKHFKGVEKDGGIQLYATWTLSAQSGSTTIRIFIQKLTHKKQQGGQTSTMSMPFDNIGESIPSADAKKVHDGFYRDWIKGSSDVVEDDCVKPKKKKVGPATLYACAVATDKETKEREKREWWAWTTPNVTWIALVRYDKTVVKNDSVAEKTEAFIKEIDEVKDKK